MDGWPIRSAKNMKTIPIIAIFFFIQLFSSSYGEEGKENPQPTINDSIKNLIGSWQSVKFEGEDVGPYKEVIEQVGIDFQKGGKFKLITTYKKGALIQFKGNPKMTADGKVISVGKILIEDKAIKIRLSDDEDDISTLLFRNGNLLMKGDGEDAVIVFKRVTEKKPQKKNKQNKTLHTNP